MDFYSCWKFCFIVFCVCVCVLVLFFGFSSDVFDFVCVRVCEWIRKILRLNEMGLSSNYRQMWYSIYWCCSLNRKHIIWPFELYSHFIVFGCCCCCDFYRDPNTLIYACKKCEILLSFHSEKYPDCSSVASVRYLS